MLQSAASASPPHEPMAPRAIHIASGADSTYACPLAVMMRSVVRALPRGVRVHFHILDGGLTTSDRERVLEGIPTAAAEIHWLRSPRERLSGLPLWGRMHVATYDKLLLEDLVDPSLGQLLWIDADTLVLRNPCDLSDSCHPPHLVHAVRDPLVPTVGSSFGVAGWRKLGLDPSLPYFNAGVLQIQLEGWRSMGVARRCLAYLREKASQVYFWDQEGINAVLAPFAGILDPTWNTQPDNARVDAPPAILHFSGNLKPWRTHGTTHWHQLYNQVRDETAWRNTRPEVPRFALLARYQASPLRRWMRPLEVQWMRWNRWRTHHLTPSK